MTSPHCFLGRFAGCLPAEVRGVGTLSMILIVLICCGSSAFFYCQKKRCSSIIERTGRCVSMYFSGELKSGCKKSVALTSNI